MHPKPRSVAAALFATWLASGLIADAQDHRPTFRSGISRVSLNVVVKDPRGRPIKDLRPQDFSVFDQGRLVQVDDFRAGEEPLSVALLVDTSGSMAIGNRLATTTQAVDLLLAQLQPRDEAALFKFDRELTEVVPFTTDLPDVRRGLKKVDPYGSTSLHDAVAAVARALMTRPSTRRAVVAITDGRDNSSALSAEAASRVASLSDVPVYVLTVANSDRPLDPKEAALEPIEGGGVARLDDLTGRTGGVSFAAESPTETNLAVRHIVSDLRAGYVLAFTPRDAPGWHPLTVQVARRDARVRTRAGYWMSSPEPTRIR